MFFGVYTEKVLGLEPSKLSVDWAEQRISIPDLSNAIIQSFIRTKRSPRTLVSLFDYPREGGIGRIAELLKERILGKGGESCSVSILRSSNITDRRGQGT